MGMTLEDLDARVRLLEAEVRHLKAERRLAVAGPMSPARQAELSRIFRETLRRMGVDVEGRPFVHPEELKRRMAEHGVLQEDRVASSGIRELRGESGE